MVHISKKRQIRKTVVTFSIFMVVMYFLDYYLGFFIKEGLIRTENPDSILSNKWFRFVYREFKIYLFGFIGYSFINKEKMNSILKVQFIMILVILDLFCLGIGIFRYFVGDLFF